MTSRSIPVVVTATEAGVVLVVGVPFAAAASKGVPDVTHPRITNAVAKSPTVVEFPTTLEVTVGFDSAELVARFHQNAVERFAEFCAATIVDQPAEIVRFAPLFCAATTTRMSSA